MIKLNRNEFHDAMHCQIFVNLLAVFVNKINITIRNPTVLNGFFPEGITATVSIRM